MGQHGQRDMPIPALPVAHLVVIQSAFAFSRLKGLLDQPALAGHSDQGFNGVFTAGGVTQIVSALWILFDAAPYQKRPRPTILDRKSTRLNSSHLGISYAVSCLKKHLETLEQNTELDRKSTRLSSIHIVTSY